MSTDSLPSLALRGPEDAAELDGRVLEAERLFRGAQVAEAGAVLAGSDRWELDARSRVAALIVDGLIGSDVGDVVTSLSALTRAAEEARLVSPELQLTATFLRFVREADFQSPDEALPGLAALRALASQAGDAQSLAGLHLAVARLEALRGHFADAHRHLELARQFAGRGGTATLQAMTSLVEVSLEASAGNLTRAARLAEEALARARELGLLRFAAAQAGNVGIIAHCRGQASVARDHLAYAREHGRAILHIALSALDTLAQIDLAADDLEACRTSLAECASIIGRQHVPSRSWYDLAHQLTRAAYLARIDDWPAVIAVVDAADGELERRQCRALRTSLLCAKARALARLDRLAQADQVLGTAVRVCPRGAVDPLIALEATKALCASLRGDVTRGLVHYDRAVAACRAIGHRAHEAWIARDRADVTRTRTGAAAVRRRPLDVGDGAMLLQDAATILGAGHSIDLLAHRLTSLLQGTTMGGRVDVRSESDREYHAESSASWALQADGTFTLQLRGSDRLVDVSVRDVASIDEIAMLKSVADLVQAAVGRTSAETADDETLWPRAAADHADAVFRSPRMVELVRIAIRLAATDVPVLICGETGTGKEILARLIHDHSAFKRGSFVPFNCSAIARELVESQLFGHRRGAFTGATDAFPGVIRTAERGTLFLDEVGDLDLAVQPKLLRFLESSEIHPVGEARPLRVPIRVVAATNADLHALAGSGRFRRDLLYRLDVARLTLPPLRERKDEIPALAALFLVRAAAECKRQRVRLGDDFIAALLLYDWPGNIRQLANEIRRVVALAPDGQTLRSADLAPEVTKDWHVRPTGAPAIAPPQVSVRLDQTLALAVEELERKFIEHAIDVAGGRVAEAAQLLGLSRKGLFLKRRRRGLIN